MVKFKYLKNADTRFNKVKLPSIQCLSNLLHLQSCQNKENVFSESVKKWFKTKNIIVIYYAKKVSETNIFLITQKNVGLMFCMAYSGLDNVCILPGIFMYFSTASVVIDLQILSICSQRLAFHKTFCAVFESTKSQNCL